MKIVFPMVVSLALLAGCGSKDGSGGSGAAQAATGARSGAAGAGSGAAGFAAGSGAAPAAGGDSFFAGDPPASVKMKATKTFAMDPGMLMITGVDAWSGGQLPGYDYMAMNKEGTVSARVSASTGVTGEINCKELSMPASLAPLRAKNLKDSVPAVLRKVGKNKFVAREGSCTGDGPKGPVEIRFLNILRKDKDGSAWHYSVIVGYPKDATQDMKNEAMAWGRSLEYNGGNGFTMP